MRRGNFPNHRLYKIRHNSNPTERMLTVSNLRDVWETKVSPTAVFHFVRNSSSDIGSACKKHEKHLGSMDTRKLLASNLVLTQNTQADLTNHLFSVHLPSLARIIDLSKPTHNLQGHLASDFVLVFEGLGQFQDGGGIVRLGERDEVHQEELEDLVEVRRGEGAQGALWACE